MATKTLNRKAPVLDLPIADPTTADEVFDRVTGATRIAGNEVKLLIDAAENYPAWLSAIANAEKRIYFESYIVHDDDQGELFAEALLKKAADGVDVKLIYDWMGGFGNT